MPTANAPDLSGVEISFSYRGRDVPTGEEAGIRIYYQAPLAETWEALPTTLNTYYNLAATPLRGPGRYALMSNVEVAIAGPGWSIFAYPVAGARPVAEALAGIAGQYGAVYGYEPADQADPWKIYGPALPTWVNDLSELRYGQGYWITTTNALTLPLRGPIVANSTPAGGPPQTLYGMVGPADAAAGDLVVASVAGVVCATTTVRAVPGGLGYQLDLPSAQAAGGCGIAGATVQIRIGEQRRSIEWRSGPARLDVGEQRIFLPLIWR